MKLIELFKKCIDFNFENEFEKEICNELDQFLTNDLPEEKIPYMAKELNSFLNQKDNYGEVDSLFEMKETRTIQETKFDKPKAYNFEKHKKKKEVDDSESLFSFIGD